VFTNTATKLEYKSAEARLSQTTCSQLY